MEVGDWPWCPHGKQGSPAVIDDSIPGGMTIENMGPEPLTFYSKSEWRREMKRRGLRPNVRHMTLPGTDKSEFTTRWV
jgi:hypothetical protein